MSFPLAAIGKVDVAPPAAGGLGRPGRRGRPRAARSLRGHIAARAARERIIASGLQSLGILALTVAFGTFAYAEDFAGKWSELSALFTWGFTANLGLEGLIAAAEKVKKG